jgi:chemosensory pili system protein ChpB (putative protein-glutamate methylesterase)
MSSQASDGQRVNSGNSPSIALISDSDFNRHAIKKLLKGDGYQVVVTLNSENLPAYLRDNNRDSALTFDAWLLDVEADSAVNNVELLSTVSELPMLLNDHVPAITEQQEHQLWQRRLLEKLETVAITGQQKLSAKRGSSAAVAQQVWVLAASSGGPDAVKAMVYGQHIDTNFDGVLVTGISRDHDYDVGLIRGEQRLMPATIAVVPVDHQLRFLSAGRVVETRSPWSGSYQPTLDQVIADLARIYRHNLGVIIFSGMCDDGAIGCRVAKACGAQVWAQTPASCLSSDMPNAAIATGCVSQQGTPEQLARELGRYMAAQTLAVNVPILTASM